MAITVQSEILGQEATANISYCYLYEPFRVNVYESDLLAVKFYVDVEIIRATDLTIVDTLVKYAEFDINAGKSFSFDLMELAQQIHDSNLFKIGTISDLITSSDNNVVSKYIYRFMIYSDKTENPVSVRKLPIVGGRDFLGFKPLVTSSNPLTEFELYGLNIAELITKWQGYTFLMSRLQPVTSGSMTPITTTLPSPIIDEKFKGAVVFWKSRLGGWCFWGFELVKKTPNHSYTGDLTVGMFNSTLPVGGNPYVPVDYTAVQTGYSYELKSLSLNQDELYAVSGINATTAVYYADPDSDRLELMRVSAISTPLDNLANGGDFSISLTNVSQTIQKTM